MKMRAVVEFWLKSLIGNFTLGGLHSALVAFVGFFSFINCVSEGNIYTGPNFIINMILIHDHQSGIVVPCVL